MRLWAWGGLTVQPHCLSKYSHYLELEAGVMDSEEPEAGVMDSESIQVRQLESAEACFHFSAVGPVAQQ